LRTETIIIKTTKEEKQKIEKKAKERGLNVSSYLRSLGIKG